MTALMPSEELPRRGGRNGVRERETGKKKRRGQERRKKEVQQSGVLSCFSVTLPSFS